MSKRNFVYITNIDFSYDNGYPEKIFGQMQAFYAQFDATQLICRYNGKTVLVKHKGKYIDYEQVHFLKLISLVTNCSFMYVRWPILTPAILLIYATAYLCRICIISEIPTYPFKKELENYSGLKYLYIMLTEKIFRPIVTHLNYKYACIGNEETVSSNKFIFFENGISKFNEPKIEYCPGNDFNFIFVGNFGRHYSRFGLDRFIEGIKSCNSNGECAVNLHIVGTNRDEFNNIYTSEIPKNILFHGYLSARELNELINSMDFGVGILGFHRVGIYEASPLKERLYLSNGLPYLTSVIDSGTSALTNAKIKVEANDAEINISMLLKKIHKNKMTSLQNKLKIFKYAQQNLNWSHTMHAILEAYRQYE